MLTKNGKRVEMRTPHERDGNILVPAQSRMYVRVHVEDYGLALYYREH